jgi:hypothetical protein
MREMHRHGEGRGEEGGMPAPPPPPPGPQGMLEDGPGENFAPDANL